MNGAGLKKSAVFFFTSLRLLFISVGGEPSPLRRRRNVRPYWGRPAGLFLGFPAELFHHPK
jgi:hypothetical protein